MEVLLFRCVWLVCLSAAATASTVEQVEREQPIVDQCFVLDLTREPIHYSLPTNLTIKPKSIFWRLKLELRTEKWKPAACIHLEDSDSSVFVQLFFGTCDSATDGYLDYLPFNLNYEIWTTVKITVTNDAVYMQKSRNESLMMKGETFKFAPNGLHMTVTEAFGVEAALGCAVNCPLHHHVSMGQEATEIVYEWQEGPLYLHISPEPSFKSMKYWVECDQDTKMTAWDMKFLMKEDLEREWHLVEVQHRGRNTTLSLNNKLQGSTQLPDSCFSIKQTIFMTGDGYLAFNCTPKVRMQVTQTGVSRKMEAEAAITLGLVVMVTLSGVFQGP